MSEKRWFWATLALSSVTVLLLVFAGWELVENRYFRDADYVTLHYLYLTRGVASSLLLAFWAAWFVWRQRLESEENLRRSQERYRGLLEAIPGAVVLFDRTFCVLEWNASAERLYGYGREEVLGKPLVTVPPSKQRELEDFLARVDGGETVLDVETLRSARDGEAFAVQLSLLPYQEPGGCHYFLEVTSDIRHVVQLRERMLQIEKLTSMGKMAAGTAHHLNSPLAALLLRVQMMRERPAHDPGEELAKIEQGLVFCQHFVSQLLEFTRASPAQRRGNDLGTLLESVASFFLPVIHSRGATLRVDAAPARGLMVVADRNQLETVLLILLSNALDAVDKGGHIQLVCARVATDKVEVRVEDNGVGISAANLTRVFEPFFTTKDPGKGTGLGLAIARNVVLDHGGTIAIESEPGHGAVVRIEFPLAKAGSESEAA
ncbi:MAG: PAS domain S-box protein [Acidobacteria bacterium]|nr:PAS domain S-box protein [Acidobacteriota bacterium]